MTGRSHWFDTAVYLVVAVAVLAAGFGVGLPAVGVIVGLVFFVLALRAAWSADTPDEQQVR